MTTYSPSCRRRSTPCAVASRCSERWAIAKHRESLQANPDFLGTHMNLAAIHAELGEMNQAGASLAEVMRLRPDFSVARIPRLPSGREFLVENLRKAGLRE